MGKTEYVDLGKVTVDKVTAKAVLIKRGEEDHWIPLSLLESDTATRVLAKAERLDHFEVADWFVEKEEIAL